MKLEYRYLANPKKVRDGSYTGLPVDVLGWTAWLTDGVYTTNLPSQEFTVPFLRHQNYIITQVRVTE